jgi:hypothetical protein
MLAKPIWIDAAFATGDGAIVCVERRDNGLQSRCVLSRFGNKIFA